MVLESNGHGVGELRLWIRRVTIMVLESNGYGVASLVLVLGLGCDVDHLQSSASTVLHLCWQSVSMVSQWCWCSVLV
jgi:hypothetical protein